MGSHLVCKVILVLFTIIFISEFVVEELFRSVLWNVGFPSNSFRVYSELLAVDLFSYCALALQDLMLSVNSIAKIVQFYPGKQGKILLSFFKHFASSCKNSSRNSCEIWKNQEIRLRRHKICSRHNPRLSINVHWKYFARLTSKFSALIGDSGNYHESIVYSVIIRLSLMSIESPLVNSRVTQILQLMVMVLECNN